MDTLEHINELFADSVYQDMRRKRYGLKICRARVDAEFADDMRNIYMRACERKACGYETETVACGLTKVTERINTL